MNSLTCEINGFSKTRLKKQSTRVTTVTGRRLIETLGEDGDVQQVEEPSDAAFGFVEDSCLDLQVGVVRPFLLLCETSSQDAAHDLDVLRKFKVTHVLNVAYGVANPFPHLLHYRTVTLLDLPDTDITSYFPEGCAFIEEARAEEGVVLVHCNAGVSRSSSMVIGYLMTRERLAFNDAFSQVKAARPSICPNPGFLLQLKNYNPQASTSS
ncbi:dual specificity protein phosphatase 19-like isoform X1 [Hypomesus transpacificus]|uniref:dual specificity protein phosphatase 19-like isoform X1 n=1 Tax=Hypomesus transpacificus TaxID=137520 RepID=UPI001F082EA6|nr:dual specificity protein phosphatase 19-like isoform X1 [Hypomesus transpacificus]